jgi:hypothetical protein
MRTMRLWNNLLHSKSKDRKTKKFKSFGSGNTKGPKQNSQNRLNQEKKKYLCFRWNSWRTQVIQDKDMTITELLQKMATKS